MIVGVLRPRYSAASLVENNFIVHSFQPGLTGGWVRNEVVLVLWFLLALALLEQVGGPNW